MTVFVEHFLNEAGRDYFSTWLTEVRRALVDFPGFGRLTEMTDVERPERALLFLTFDSLDNLRHWGGSEAHRRVLERIRPYQLRKQYSQLLRPRE